MDKVVQSLSARGEDCVRLRHQIALEPCEPRPPDARFAIGCPRFVPQPSRGRRSELRRFAAFTADSPKRDRLVGRLVFEIAKELDLTRDGISQPAVDLRIRFGIASSAASSALRSLSGSATKVMGCRCRSC